MRLTRIVLAGIALLPFCSTPGEACGDKFLVIGRGMRAPRARAAHKGSILLFLDPRSPLPTALQETRVVADLKRVGHSLKAVDNREQAEAALKSGNYDLVVADISDMAALKAQAGAATSRPVLLPVLHNRTDEELAAVQKQYRWVMRSPNSGQRLLAVIDDALAYRARERAQDKTR
jgi:DNA-binding NtrC family response regulator